MMNRKEKVIYQKLKKAIIQQSLQPNVQLVEKDLAEAFEVSRTPVRNVLRRLAYEKLVKIIENKGAFVSSFSEEEAKEVFEMRRIIESHATRKACDLYTQEQIQELHRMVKEEEELSDSADVYELVQRFGHFHLKIAEMGGNSYFYQYLQDLISMTNVIVGIYGNEMNTCSDHFDIYKAIKEGDKEFAERIILEHLNEIEENLDFKDDKKAMSLTDIFK